MVKCVNETTNFTNGFVRFYIKCELNTVAKFDMIYNEIVVLLMRHKKER